MKKQIKKHFEKLFGVELSEKELYEEVTNSFDVWFKKQELWFQLVLIDYIKEIPKGNYIKQIELLKKKLKGDEGE